MIGDPALDRALVLAVFGLILAIPIARIMPRAGWNPWVSVLFLIPGINLILLYVLAFKKWPLDRSGL